MEKNNQIKQKKNSHQMINHTASQPLSHLVGQLDNQQGRS